METIYCEKDAEDIQWDPVRNKLPYRCISCIRHCKLKLLRMRRLAHANVISVRERQSSFYIRDNSHVPAN